MQTGEGIKAAGSACGDVRDGACHKTGLANDSGALEHQLSLPNGKDEASDTMRRSY